MHSARPLQVYRVKTPLRVSLFGGGTDYPEYFERHKGAVLGFAIDKFIYHSAFEHLKGGPARFSLSHYLLEEVSQYDEIAHPLLREALRDMAIEAKWSVHVHSDLPGRSGLGSSSSFGVGTYHLLHLMKGLKVSPQDLMKKATHLERDILGGGCGIQDHMHAAFGGLKRYDFYKNTFKINAPNVHADVLSAFNNSMFLVHTGISRYANMMVGEQVKKTKEHKIDQSLHHLYELVEQGEKVFAGQNAEDVLKDIGAMLHEGWMIKRSLSSQISSKALDEIYESTLQAGALGGKLCGAGGGGFFFFIIPEKAQRNVFARLPYLNFIPVRICDHGSLALG